MNYGIPYMGSKATILKNFCGIFPKADHFYDLFGGGFSVTHFMLLHRGRDFKYFHFNEIRNGVCDLIRDAISGKYNYGTFRPSFIGRDEFFKRIDEPYIKILWSFGNNGEGYLFSKDIEPYKRSMHNAIVFNKFDGLAEKVLGIGLFKEDLSIEDRRLFLINRIEYYRLTKIPDFLHPYLNTQQLQQIKRLKQLQQLERLKQLQQLERLERLQQLQQLQRLQQLERLRFYNTSYEQVPILDNAIVYCDIPYKGTAEYDKNTSFNHEKFYDWADGLSAPVFISEYALDDKRFKCIHSMKKRSRLVNFKDQDELLVKDEKIFVNKTAYKILRGM